MLAAATLLLTACSSSGTSGQTSATATGAAASSGATAAVKIGTTPAGKVLVAPDGKTLYAFASDTKQHSVCTGSCASYWPPVPGSDAPKGTVGGMTATFGSIKRADGSTQLTVNGYPMYTYAGDSASGQDNGQGKNLSGGLWWVVSPKGSWIMHSTGSSPSPSSGAGSGY
jgi:predicted lipoprotein with Yx(FWY)xxD motif